MVHHPNYQITIERERRLLRVDLHGQWDQAMLEQFRSDLRATVTAARSRGALRVRMLMDASRTGVQPVDLVPTFQELSEELRESVERAASVVSGTLAKLQFRRVTGFEKLEIFTDAGEAIAWLLGADAF